MEMHKKFRQLKDTECKKKNHYIEKGNTFNTKTTLLFFTCFLFTKTM